MYIWSDVNMHIHIYIEKEDKFPHTKADIDNM